MYIIIMYLYFISLLETFYANKVIQKENVHYTTKIKLYPLKMKLDYIALVIQKLTAFCLVGLCSDTWCF